MTQPNKYIHEELGWVAYKIPELENVYRVYTDDMGDYNNFTDEQIDSKILDIEEHMVIALGFQPVEEEKKAPQRFYDFIKNTPDYVKGGEETINQFIERIYPMYLKYLPKQELIPLDVEKIIEEIKPCFDWSAVRYYQLREVLSKYSISKQELIPLDMEKIIDEYVKKMQEVFNKGDEKRDAGYELKQILSKYGTTPQKKQTKEDIYKVVGNPIERDSFQAGKSQGAQEILKHLGLLQE